MKIKNKQGIKIGIVGIGGKMGQSIAKLAINDPKVFINSGIDHAKSKLAGKDIGDLVGEASLNIYVSDNIQKFFNKIDVIVEFGLEEATKMFVKAASKRNVAFVSGSTVCQSKL